MFCCNFGNPVAACDYIAWNYLPHCECKEEWMPCAPENGECGCEGTVRYGAGLEWNFKHGLRSSLSVACTTAEFGDPAPGVAKACECIAVDTCTDLTFSDGVAWHDNGLTDNTCSWYANNYWFHERGCVDNGRNDGGIYTASEACCVCGGGKRTYTEVATSVPGVATSVPGVASPVSVSVSGVSGRSETTLRRAAVAAAAVLVIGAVCLLFLRRSRQGAAYFKPQEPVSQRPESVEIDQIAIVE